jgi:hypothetical protein
MYAAQAAEALQRAQAQIQQQRGQFLQQSGLAGQYDTGGNFTGFKVAAGPGTNQGTYQQTLQNNAQAAEQVDASNRGSGFAGGGLSQQAVDAAKRYAESTTSQWAQGVTQTLGDLGQQQTQATQDYNSGLYNQFLSEVQGAIANGTFNPADFSQINIPGYDNPYAGYNPATSGAGFTPPTGGGAKPPKKGVRTSKYGHWANGRWIEWKPKKGGK